MKFADLKVNARIVNALTELNITEPTDIQEKSIPLIMEGKDVIGISNTGSGKTAAFGIPIIEKIEPGKGVQTLIMAPTRELAVQIAGEIEKFSKYMQVTVATIFGGVALPPQAERIKKSEVVVGTPGRILDLTNRNALPMQGLKNVVLDEADKMVEMGFIEDVNEILSHTPKKKQMILFGATIKEEIKELQKHHMTDPVIAKGGMQVKGELLQQFYCNVEQHEKFSYLVHLLKKEKAERVIIFCSTRNTVEIISKNLKKQSFKTEMIHGKLTQSRRLAVIDQFNKGAKMILVASAVAARGLHIQDVTHVFNYDLSQDPEEYIHRIGRTARAGESGKAITLLSQRDFPTFNDILNRFPLKIHKMEKESFEKLHFEARQSTGRFNSRSGSGRSSYNDRERSKYRAPEQVQPPRFGSA